ALLTWTTEGTVGIDGALIAQQPWWMWIGGLVGVIAMTTTVLLLPIIGALYTTALNVTAQVITSMMVDQLGLYEGAVYKASSCRLSVLLIGLLSALIAVAAGRAGTAPQHA